MTSSKCECSYSRAEEEEEEEEKIERRSSAASQYQFPPAWIERVGGQHQVPAGGGGGRDETVSEEVHYLLHATAEL